MITITNSARNRIESILTTNYLRLAVMGGGCSGMQYVFSLEDKTEDDIVVDNLLIIDSISLAYLDNSKLDFVSSLMGDMFELSNPNATTTCGCGESFAI